MVHTPALSVRHAIATIYYSEYGLILLGAKLSSQRSKVTIQAHGASLYKVSSMSLLSSFMQLAEHVLIAS